MQPQLTLIPGDQAAEGGLVTGSGPLKQRELITRLVKLIAGAAVAESGRRPSHVASDSASF